MKHYLYDGSFEGLLTAIFYAYSNKDEVMISRKNHYTPHLFFEPHDIITEEDKFDRVYNSILTKLSSATLKRVYLLYLSELEDADTLAFNYLKLCYTYSDDINLAKNNDTIISVDTYCRKVTLESHRFKGFVRFNEVSPGIYYSKIEPDHHILPLIMNHFIQRFSDQHFIIHDSRRNVAIIYNKEESLLKELSTNESSQLVQCIIEDEFAALFKSFYHSINIVERKNSKQQLRYMPKRYWKNLVELN